MEARPATPSAGSASRKTGKVYLIKGKAAGWTAGVSLSTADVAFVGENADDKAGKSVAILDFNGDGFADIVIGAEGEDTGGNKAGKTYLIFGGQEGGGHSVDWGEGTGG